MRIALACLFGVMLLLAAPIEALADADQASKPNQLLTPGQKRAVRSLVAKFRRAKRDPGQQAAILNDAMKLSPHAVEDIRGLIEGQLTPSVTRYRQSFLRAASGKASAKFAAADKGEILRIQDQVNALRKDPNLSKEQVKRVGDPGMERLAELVLVDRVEVLQSNAKLVAEREKLVPEGKLWEVANAYLAKLGASTGDSEKVSMATSFDEFLKQEEEIAVRLALPMPSQTKSILKANEALAKRLDPEEAKCVLSLNLMRILLGLEPLLIDLKLTAAGRDHSKDMREHDFFSHDSPIPGKTKFTDRARNFGANASGENIAWGYPTGPAVNMGWFHSPGHHKNMLGKHTRVGVGRDATHWTELFSRE